MDEGGAPGAAGADDEAAEDGRVARGRRNRQQLVDAFLDLVGSGHQHVTGAHVAEAAGLSVRSLWTHFSDLEALYDAASLDLWQRHRAAHVEVDPALPLDDRVRAFCDQRCTELEALAPYARTAALREPFSPALRASRRRFVDDVTAEVDAVFGAELATAAAPAEARIALVAVSSWPCWSTWRDDHGLDTARARATLEHLVRALLGGG